MEWLQLLGAAIGGGAGAWAAIRVELRWHRADITRAQKTADGAHRRLDKLQGAV